MNYNFIRPDLIVGSCLQVIIVFDIFHLVHFYALTPLQFHSNPTYIRLQRMLTSFAALE